MSATVLTNNVAEIAQILSFRRCFHAVCRADVYYAAKRTFSWKTVKFSTVIRKGWCFSLGLCKLYRTAKQGCFQ